jgi:hypothetical protein
MIDPVTAATVVKTGFDIGSSLFGGDDGPGFQEQLNNQRVALRDLTRQKWAETFRAADKYGIHPLVALGANQTHDGTMPVDYSAGQSSANKWSQLGSSVSRATEALMTERERLQNRLLESQIDGQEISNAKNASDLAVATTGAPPGMIESLASQSVSSAVNNEGVEAAESPLYKKYKMGNNSHIYGLSQDAQETVEGFGHIGGSALGLAALLGTIPLYARDVAQAGGKTKWYKKINKYTPGYWLAKKWKSRVK